MYAYKDRICNDAFVLEFEIKKLKIITYMV